MEKFSYDDVARLSYQYEDVSEPLKEYTVLSNGELYETSSSCTLLGVKKNGKWGWINTSGRFVIPAMYDSGFVLCYDGIISRLEKNGRMGGIYRDSGNVAFSFKYKMLSHAYGDTYVAHNDSGKCALVKPGDRMLTGFNYVGFSQYNRGCITDYVKTNFLGIRTEGRIDLNTGKELS